MESFNYATDSDWDQADALQSGSEREDQCWVLTDRDVWHRNPFFTGTPTPHPEFEEADYTHKLLDIEIFKLFDRLSD